MEELRQAIANSSIEQQVSLLPQALDYGDLGINFLIDCLSNSELEVRAKAYELLQDVELQKAQKAIAPGLLLNPGDRIYSVYQSGTSFNDDGYSLDDCVVYLDELHVLIYGEEYFDEEAEFRKSKRLFCYLKQDEAEEKAESLHRELIQKEGIGGLGFEWEQKDLSFEQWCIEHDLEYDQNNWQSEGDVLDYLYLPENIELFSQFWKDGIGRFAFVQEEFIQQKVRLRIEEKLTKRTFEENIAAEFIARSKDDQQESFNLLIRTWSSDRHKTYLLPEFLKYGESGIDFLVKCLENRELQTRAKAYELLQNVDSVKAQNSIIKGLLLNPGDIIYSVYKSAIGFTDSSYLVVDYIDDSKAFRAEIYGKSKPDEDDGIPYSKCSRIFCYVNLEVAQEKAEYLHQQKSKESGADFLLFFWEKRNPSFDLKQWCLNRNLLLEPEWNNLPNKSEWVIRELIVERYDPTLLDELNRSQYIYHPDHIDTWCRDNDVFYEQNISNRDNYYRLLRLLELPRNLELLSKFYEDGVGRFAFVREEVVEQKTYVQINKNLKNETTNLVVRPRKYSIHAVDFLLHILNSKYSEPEQIMKARQFLLTLDSEHIPF